MILPYIPFQQQKMRDSDHADLAAAFARNARLPPAGASHFQATSGARLPYYLNLATNLLDPDLSRRVADAVILLLHRVAAATLHDWGDAPSRRQRVFCVGPAMAGGTLVSQICTRWTQHDCARSGPLTFVYMRKERKQSGTLQQLEGPQEATSRTPASPPAPGIWVDDVLSTGRSLSKGAALLKRDYNIDVIAALFIVDRKGDRREGSGTRIGSIPVFSLLDAAQIHCLIDATQQENVSAVATPASQRPRTILIGMLVASVTVIVMLSTRTLQRGS